MKTFSMKIKLHQLGQRYYDINDNLHNKDSSIKQFWTGKRTRNVSTKAFIMSLYTGNFLSILFYITDLKTKTLK